MSEIDCSTDHSVIGLSGDNVDLRTKRAQLEKGCSTNHSVIGLPGDCSGSFECKFVDFECAAPSCLLAEST